MNILRAGGLLVLLLVGTGCAALFDTPARVRAAFSDPLRVKRILTRSLESCVGGAVAGLVALPFGPLIGCPAATAAEFLAYEYILEPTGLTGPYWERGPRETEQFSEEGERFKDERRELQAKIRVAEGFAAAKEVESAELDRLARSLCHQLGLRWTPVPDSFPRCD